MLTTFTCIHKETKEKIKYDDYKMLSDEEKKMYNVYPKMQVFRVFNVQQTNLQEARPELWNKLANGDAIKLDEGDKMSFEPMDVMIRDNRWICPIKPMHQDKAYFSISKNEIVVPEKAQFKDGESYYGTLWHEMTHSTGIEGQLDRIKPAAFGSDEYAREELVAELGSALVAQRYGMSKALKEESCAYLKSWLEQLKESPQFIKTTLLDVKKASSLVTQNIDKIAQELDWKTGSNRITGNGVRPDSPPYKKKCSILPLLTCNPLMTPHDWTSSGTREIMKGCSGLPRSITMVTESTNNTPLPPHFRTRVMTCSWKIKILPWSIITVSAVLTK